MKIEELYQKKLIEPEQLDSLVTSLRRDGKTIATLNGSFDLLHSGHLYILSEAAQTADVLIVALNSDASIRLYKGEDRPFIPLLERRKLLTAIPFVDYVSWFDEETPCRLIEQIRPDVHVNGCEYGADCVEAPTVKNVGARLHLVNRIEGLSTSEIVQKIQQVCV